MKIDINLLPKKLNDINYFKKVENGCEIYSYNSKIETRNEVIVVKLQDCEIEHDFCVESKTIDMVKVLYPCEINVTDKNFIIKSQRGKFTSKLLNEQLFMLSNDEFSKNLNIDMNILVKASGYVAKNEKKPILCGVRIDDNCNVYATDSFRAYFYRTSDELSPNGITIPINYINLVKSLIDKDEVYIKYNNNVLMTRINPNIEIYGRLLDGNYPDMSKILANRNMATSVEIDKDEIVDRLSVASNIGNDNDKRTIIKFTTNKFEALGSNNFEAEIKFENGNEYPFKVQFDYLDQAFKTITNNVIFKVTYKLDSKIGLMMFLENEKETCLVLGIK